MVVALPEARARPALPGREQGSRPPLGCMFPRAVVRLPPSPRNQPPSDADDAVCSDDGCPRKDQPSAWRGLAANFLIDKWPF